MTLRLIAAVEAALAQLEGVFHPEASVVVQFPAGALHEVKEALAQAKDSVTAAPAPAETPEDPKVPSAPLEPEQQPLI